MKCTLNFGVSVPGAGGAVERTVEHRQRRHHHLRVLHTNAKLNDGGFSKESACLLYYMLSVSYITANLYCICLTTCFMFT